jgi:hypothetical protein
MVAEARTCIERIRRGNRDTAHRTRRARQDPVNSARADDGIYSERAGPAPDRC